MDAANDHEVDFMTTKLPKRHHHDWRGQIDSQLSSFGARLRELRQQRGWTLEELAEASGFSRGFLSRLESGGRQASIAAALTLARIFEVSLAELFESPLAAEPCVIVRAAEQSERSVHGLRYSVLSKAGRFFNVQPMRVKVSPFPPRRSITINTTAKNGFLFFSGNLRLLSPASPTICPPAMPRISIRACRTGSSPRALREAQVLVVASPLSGAAPAHRPLSRQFRAIPGIVPVQLLSLQSLTTSPAPSGRKSSASAHLKTRN